MLCPKCKVKINTRVPYKELKKHIKGYKYYIQCPNCGGKFMRDETRIAVIGSIFTTIIFTLMIIPGNFKSKLSIVIPFAVIMIMWLIKESIKIPLHEFNEEEFNKINCTWCGRVIYLDMAHKLEIAGGGTDYLCEICYNSQRRNFRILLIIFILVLLFSLYLFVLSQ